jgi:5-exo-hydroxycamphor dehydrogenase
VSAERANAAGFQELALVSPQSPLFRIPDGVDPAAVIAFGCALPTAIGGFARLGPIPRTVVVQGSGPVGLASCLLASLGGAEQVIVIGAPHNRLAMARHLGATETLSVVDSGPEQRRARILELTGGHGADAVIEAAGRPAAFPEGITLLANNGRMLIMGLYSGDAVAPVDPVYLNNHNLHLIGTLGSPASSYGDTVRIAAEHGERLGFADMVTHRFPLEQTEEGIRAAGRGESIKSVIVPTA